MGKLKWLAILVGLMSVAMVCAMTPKVANVLPTTGQVKESIIKTLDYKTYETTKRHYWSDEKGTYYQNEGYDNVVQFKAKGQKHWHAIFVK